MVAVADKSSPEQLERQTRYLFWWLLLALVFEYARPGSWVPVLEAVKLNSLVPLGLLFVTFFAKGLRSPKEIFSDPLAKWMVIYISLVFFSLVHAEVTVYAVERSTQVLGYFFLFWIIARTATTPGRIRGVFFTLVCAHLFLLAMNPLVVLDPTSRHYIQGATFLGDGNDFALSLCILVPLGIDLALSLRAKWLRIVCLAICGVLLLAAIGTASRGATLGLVCVAAYLWWRSPRKVLTLCLIGIVATGVLVYASDLYFERMATLTNYEEEGSAQGRIIAWGSATQMALDNPLLGVGAGQFPTEFGTRYRPEDYGGRYMTAHSMYFLILGELGLPGLIALLFLVFGNMKANANVVRALKGDSESERDSRRLLTLLTGGLVGFAVAGAFLSVAYYPHVFVLTGLCVAARRVALSRLGAPEDGTAADSALAFARPVGKPSRLYGPGAYGSRLQRYARQTHGSARGR